MKWGVVPLLALSGCPNSQNTQVTEKVPPPISEYVSPNPHDKDIAIVFVHGVFGDSKTWTASGNSFPTLLSNDPELGPLVDAFVFEYSSPQLQTAPDMTAIVGQLSQTLTSERVFEDHQQVVFLAHSMGGLIVRQLITQRFLADRKDTDKVPFVFFYATPGDGTEIADVARKVSSNPQLKALIPLKSNELLKATSNAWLSIPQNGGRPASYCAYETKTTDHFQIVSETSARAGCDRAPVGLTADHIEIVKPGDRGDLRYKVFANALRESAIPKLHPGVEVTFQNVTTKKRTTALSLTLLQDGKPIGNFQSSDHFEKGNTNRVFVPARFTRDQMSKLELRVNIDPGLKNNRSRQDGWTFTLKMERLL
jgi:hypothetical protein